MDYTAEIWLILIVITAGGAVGGCINALMSDNGFIIPRSEAVGEGKIVRPGFLGNAAIGAVAAFISWGMYGPFAPYALVGGKGEAPEVPVELTLSALVGAVLVGVGGARWLSNEVDKMLLRSAAAKAASASKDVIEAANILTASPAHALEIASRLSP